MKYFKHYTKKFAALGMALFICFTTQSHSSYFGKVSSPYTDTQDVNHKHQIQLLNDATLEVEIESK